MANKQTTIPLESFTLIMQALIDIDAKEDRFKQDMQRYLNGDFVCDFANGYVSEILKGLEGCFEYGDVNDPWLIWWFWDSPKMGTDPKYSYVEDDTTKEKYSLETIPLLYEYLSTGKTRVVLAD